MVLNPDFIEAHDATVVTNRSIKTEPLRKKDIQPFYAVIEFKLNNKSLDSGRTKSAINELGKLKLSNESPLCYLVVFQRYRRRNLNSWKKYWPLLSNKLSSATNIRSIIVVKWLGVDVEQEIYSFGNWVVNQKP